MSLPVYDTGQVINALTTQDGAAPSVAWSTDIITYSIGKGAFLGGGLQGAVIEKRDTLNRGYYGDPGVTPEAIVLEGRHKNAKADRLRDTLAPDEITQNGTEPGTRQPGNRVRPSWHARTA